MKKTLNAFIKQSAQSKKGPTFIDVNPQVRSNPYEPEMSIREGAVGTIAKVAKNMGVAGVSGSVAKTVDDVGTSVGAPYPTQNLSGWSVASGTAQAGANRASANLAARAALGKARARATGKAVGVGTKAVGVGSKAAGLVSKGAALAGLGVAARRIPLVAAGLAGYDAYKGYNAQPNATFGRKVTNAAQNALSGFTMGYLVDPPKGIKEGFWDTLILRGAKAATPMVTKVLGNIEKRVAARAAAKDTTSAAKLTPKPPVSTNPVTAAPKITPKFEPEVARRLGTTRSSIPLTPRVPRPAKVAAPSKPVVPPKLPASITAIPSPGRIRRAVDIIKRDGPTAGASIAASSALDMATPHFLPKYYGDDPSYMPKGPDSSTVTLGTLGALAAAAGRDKSKIRLGTKWGLALGGVGQGALYAKSQLWDKTRPEYKRLDAEARAAKAKQQPTQE